MSRLLIEGGLILSFDPAVGDLETGTVLVEDGRIAEVGPRVEAAGASVVELGTTASLGDAMVTP